MSAKNISSISQLRAETLQSRDVVELLADKWRIPILQVLEKRVLRTHELQSAMRQVSPKMLTQTLRGMERDGLVLRMMRPVAPPHVEYKRKRLANTPVRMAGSVLMCSDDRKNRVVSAQATYTSGSSAVGG